MRSADLKCPKCGELAKGSCDMIPAVKRFVHTGAGLFDLGKTVANPQFQQVESNGDGQWRLVCPNRHYWYADVLEDDGTKAEPF